MINLLLVSGRTSIMEFNFEGMNLQKGDRLDMNDAAGYKQTNERQQERVEA